MKSQPGCSITNEQVIVIGAGCVGLTAALALAFKGFNVTVLGKHLPGDSDIFYASNWAGACWSPSADHEEERHLLATSYRRLIQIAQTHPHSGVCIVRARESYDEDPNLGDRLQIWHKDIVLNFRPVDADPVSGYSYTCEYDTPVIDPPIYMPWLKAQFEKLGGKVERRAFSSLDEVYASYPRSAIIINATGVGSRNLGGVNDPKSFPDRGQNTLVASHDTRGLYFRVGKEFSYVIPRPKSGILVCGGIHQPWNTSSVPDMNIAADQIRRTNLLAPTVVTKSPSIVSYVVGIRPGREGGYRMEVEPRTTSEGDKKFILHAYGHGHNGYSMSYGTAGYLSNQVEKIAWDLSRSSRTDKTAKL